MTSEVCSTIRNGETISITALAFLPNGKFLASAQFHCGTIHLWDPKDRQLLGVIVRQIGYPRTIMFSPHSHLLGSGSRSLVRLWDPMIAIKQRDKPQSISSTNPIRANVFPLARLWDAMIAIKQSDKPQSISSPNPIRAIVFSPDGQLLASAHGSGSFLPSIQLWNPSTGEQRYELKPQRLLGRILVMSFAPNSKLLASLDLNGKIVVWDLSKKAACKEFQDIPDGEVDKTSLMFSADGRYLASSVSGRWSSLWDVSKGGSSAILKNFDGHSEMAFSTDNQQLAVIANGTIQIWDLTTQRIRYKFQGHGNTESTAVGFLPDGRLIAFPSCIGLQVWDVKANKEIEQIRTGKISRLSFTADGFHLETEEGLIKLTYIPTSNPQTRTPSCSSYILKEYPEGTWVTWNNHDILWVPYERQPYNLYCYLMWKNILAIGLDTGRVIFTHLRPDLRHLGKYFQEIGPRGCLEEFSGSRCRTICCEDMSETGFLESNGLPSNEWRRASPV